MPGVVDPVGGGVQATDYGRGTHLPGAVEWTVAVQGVRGGDGERIIGGAQDDTAWASCIEKMELENLGHRGRSVACGAIWWRDAQDKQRGGQQCE